MIELAPIEIPDFGVETLPDGRLDGDHYAERCRRAYLAAEVDWLVVYADREHFANVMYLAGFEPRFEEALLLLGPDDCRILVTGNECVPFAATSPLPGLLVLLAQTMSLLGQSRSEAPRLRDVLSTAGLQPGQSAGLIGWKYLEAEEWEGAAPPAFMPAPYVEAVVQIVGRDNIVDRTTVLLHPETGHRSMIGADEIAVFEPAASKASRGVWDILSNIRPGDTEHEAARRYLHAGEPFNVHMMLAASSPSEGPVVGLSSPGNRILSEGDGVTCAIGLRGGLSARAGLISNDDEDFVELAKRYFAGLLRWYEVADIGVRGGDIHQAVTETLAAGGLRSLLNPGHLTGHEEWSNTPIRAGADDRIRSGMHMQVDVIPAPMPIGRTLNCEDTVVFANAGLRDDIARRHPKVWARIRARREFMIDRLGVRIAASVLPLSDTPMCLAPLLLQSGSLLRRISA